MPFPKRREPAKKIVTEFDLRRAKLLAFLRDPPAESYDPDAWGAALSAVVSHRLQTAAYSARWLSGEDMPISITGDWRA